MVTAIFPGTFDPVTNGHVDIATRAAALFPTLIVAVYDVSPKNLLFTTKERVNLFRKSVKGLANVKVISYQGLTIDLARKLSAKVVVRGLRMGSDFEYEFEMALMNQKLAPDVEIVCLMSSLDYQFLSASLIKEVAQLKGDIHNFVPPHVAVALREKARHLEDAPLRRDSPI